MLRFHKKHPMVAYESLAGDIKIDEKECDEIYTQCCMKFQNRLRRQQVRRRCSVSFLAVLLVIGMCVIMTNINHTVVYATGQDAQNIFSNGNTVYWIPDGIFPGSIKTEKGNEIQIGKTDKSALQIRVYKGEKYEDIWMVLERGENGDFVELVETDEG